MAVFNKAVMIKENASSDASNIFDLMVEAVQIDHSLFESLIEVDFAEAYNEAGIIVLTEEEKASANEAQKKGIFTKVFEFIQNVAKTIDHIFKSLIEFIGNLISNDKNLWSKYGKIMNTKSAVEKCPVKGKFIASAYYKEVSKKINEILTKFKFDEEDPNKPLRSSASEVEYSREDLVKSSGDEPLLKAMSNEDYGFMINMIHKGYSDAASEAKTARKNALDNLKGLEKEFDRAKKEATKAGNDVQASNANSTYKKLTEKATIIRSISSKLSSMINTACAVNRGAFLKIASWAIKNPDNNILNKGENKNSFESDNSRGRDEINKKETPVDRAMNLKDENNFSSDIDMEAARLEAFDMLIDLENETFINSLVER